MSDPVTFTSRSARSAALLAALTLVIGVETGVLHMALAQTYPVLAWSLSILSLCTAAWLVGDYRAMGHRAVAVDAVHVHLYIGWRATARIPRDTIRTTLRPTWRERPATGSSGYVNLTKPAVPNLIFTCTPAATVRLPGGLTRQAHVIALHVDDADALAALLHTETGRTTS